MDDVAKRLSEVTAERDALRAELVRVMAKLADEEERTTCAVCLMRPAIRPTKVCEVCR